MKYLELPIHQRINAKNNALILYRAFMRVVDYSGKHLLVRISKHNGDMFNPTVMMKLVKHQHQPNFK